MPAALHDIYRLLFCKYDITTSIHSLTLSTHLFDHNRYNLLYVYCHELAPSTISLTGDRAQGDDSKQYAYSTKTVLITIFTGDIQTR